MKKKNLPDRLFYILINKNKSLIETTDFINGLESSLLYIYMKLIELIAQLWVFLQQYLILSQKKINLKKNYKEKLHKTLRVPPHLLQIKI